MSTMTKNVLTYPKQKLMILSMVCSMLIAISAQISLPLYPVPVTLQTLTIMIIAMLGGANLGLTTVSLYLLEGAIGMPVFAGLGSGLPHLFGPTGGYLFGFLAMAAIASFFAERGFCKTVLGTFAVALIASASSFVLGVLVLGQYVGWSQAIAVGVTPFVLGEVLKAIFVASFVPRFKK